jgi:hypothetical protein
MSDNSNKKKDKNILKDSIIKDVIINDVDNEIIVDDDNIDKIIIDDNDIDSDSDIDNSDTIDNDTIVSDNDDIDSDIDDNGVDDGVDDDTVYFKFNTTKHRLEGKHSLKRDTIFHGKLDKKEDDEYESIHYISNSDYYNKDFPIEKGTMYDLESRNFEEMESQRKLKKRVYELLRDNTELDFTTNRRKPNKQAFNNYYEMILNDLGNSYTKSEIFVELSYYFTDHIFNMYKLLYPKHATDIIMELKEKGYLNELDDMKFI